VPTPTSGFPVRGLGFGQLWGAHTVGADARLDHLGTTRPVRTRWPGRSR